MADRRWIRLDVGWMDTEWVSDLPPGGRLAWIALLAHAKLAGKEGSVQALAPRVAAKKWDIPQPDVEEMLAAAEADGALSTDERGDWIVTGWNRYQSPDPTNAERKRRWRERHDNGTGDTDGTGGTRTGTPGNTVPRHATETETETSTPPTPPSGGCARTCVDGEGERSDPQAGHIGNRLNEAWRKAGLPVPRGYDWCQGAAHVSRLSADFSDDEILGAVDKIRGSPDLAWVKSPAHLTKRGPSGAYILQVVMDWRDGDSGNDDVVSRILGGEK